MAAARTVKTLMRVRRDDRGATATFTALILPVLLGCAGLGAETVMWYATERNMHGASDAAAFSGAVVIGGGGKGIAQAKATAATNGYIDQTGGVTVMANQPPLSGAY